MNTISQCIASRRMYASDHMNRLIFPMNMYFNTFGNEASERAQRVIGCLKKFKENVVQFFKDAVNYFSGKLEFFSMLALQDVLQSGNCKVLD